MSKFELGQVVITRTALDELHAIDVLVALDRHALGDWGELCPDDRAENDRALADGSRLLSAYRDRHATKFWVITEWDHTYTTVLLPNDY